MRALFPKPQFGLLFLTIISAVMFNACRKDKTELKIDNIGTQWLTYNTSNGLPTDKVSAITMDQENNMWVATTADSLYHIEGDGYWDSDGHWQDSYTRGYHSFICEFLHTNIHTVYDTNSSDGLKSLVCQLAFDSQNKLFAGTTSPTALQSMQYGIWSSTSLGDFTIPDYLFNEITVQNNELWFGAYNKGLFHYESGLIENFDQNNSIIPYPEYVKDTEFDASGKLWFITSNTIMSLKMGIMKIEWDEYGMQEIEVDAENAVWMVKYSGVSFELIRHKNGETTRYQSMTFGGISPPAISDMAISPSGGIWISTTGYYGQGLFQFQNNEWTNYTAENSNLQSNELRQIEFDHLGNLWIGSKSNGLTIFNPTGILVEH